MRSASSTTPASAAAGYCGSPALLPALQEFLDERPRALENLARFLAERTDRPGSLDGTVGSLVPLWRSVKPLLTERTTETPDPEVSASPTWLRYRIGTEPTLSPESVALIDGVISCLCRVVEQDAPKARWRIGYNRIKSYRWQNHPVLALNNVEVPLAALVPVLPEDKPACGTPQMTTKWPASPQQ